MKVCSKCGAQKDPASFAKNGTGTRPDCKQCRNEQMRHYGQQTRPAVIARAKLNYAQNRERRLKQASDYLRANREQCRLKSARYYAEHREEELAKRKAYAKKYPEALKALSARREARKTAAAGTCTAEQLKARFEFYGQKCAYCGSGRHLAADHVIPLARGGSNFPANIRPACKPCNSSKGAKKLSEWLALKAA